MSKYLKTPVTTDASKPEAHRLDVSEIREAGGAENINKLLKIGWIILHFTAGTVEEQTAALMGLPKGDSNNQP